MAETTPRFGLPLLAAGQAQKELYHNEAVTLLEALAQPVAETLGDTMPPAAPISGQSWIVGTAPSGAWAGAAASLAIWTDGGWRFVAPAEGMWVWVRSAQLWARYGGGAWLLGMLTANALSVGGAQVVGARQPAIAAPSGGSVVDTGARTAIAAILVALRTHGLIAP